MRGRIFGAIGVLWGGALTFRGSFVALLLIVGAYYLLRPRREG